MKKLLFGLVLALLACGADADEFRGVWVDGWGAGFLDQTQVTKLLGTPGNPSSKGDIRNANLNAVVVQVRRRADVCYPSAMGEPYFSGLSPADFNALQAIIDAAHDTTGGKQRIEVHAWIVVFATASGSATSPLYYLHNDPSDPENYWMTLSDTGAETSDKALDPGHPRCLEYLVDVCMDLVTNFDIDGLHYDYIRFTANNQGYNPTSVARYNERYGLTGQPPSSSEQFKQWRRDQVTALVRQVYARVQSVKPNVKLSGAFVTWNPSPTSSTRTAFQATRPYYDVYSDWDSWVQEGIVDIAIPMTYYNWATYPNDYTRWMNFEKDRKFNRHMVVGPGIYLNSLQNAINEILMTRDASPLGNYCQGFCGYSYRVPYNGGTWANFAPQLLAQVTSEPADIPPMPWKVSPTKGHISGTVTYAPDGTWGDGVVVTITGPENRTMRCDGTGFYAFIDLTPGVYTVTATKTGYPNAQTSVNVQIGAVTGNMYVTDLVMGGTAPVISNVQASNIGTTSATITWNTDQASSSQVEYGLTTSYGQTTSLDPTPVTTHTVNLTGLTPNKLYHYRVISTNANGSSTSADYLFTTGEPPAISNVQIVDITSNSVRVTWNTNTPTDGRVQYGLTTGYGSEAAEAGTGTSHSVSITGLTPNTPYHCRCVSSNAFGTAYSEDYVFSTLGVTTEIVIDNTDPGWTNTSPGSNTWSVGSLAEVPKIGINYLYRAGDGSLTESSVTRKCRWTPDLPTAGLYDVYVFYQMGTNRNSAAPYKIFYDGGQLTSVQNQYSPLSNQGGWFLIGSNLPFAAGSGGYVELTTLSLDTALVSADAAKWVLKPDVTAPHIISVSVEPALAAGGDTISVTVQATDDLGVDSVTANGQPLTHISGSLWTGVITADPVLGAHIVTVVAADAASNSAADSSASYTTARVVGLSGRSIADPVAAMAEGLLFKTWGRVTRIDADRFILKDGVSGGVEVYCPSHGLSTGDFGWARGIWRAGGASPVLECRPEHVVKVE